MMAFPWRKVKSGQISRLVNDHLDSSRKRRDGSSLVVETGFPTSLVDLFMKNREKLKKKKQSKLLSVVDSDGTPPPPPPPPCPTPSVASGDVNEILATVGGGGEQSQSVSESDARSAVETDGVVSKHVFMVAFKLFLVVFLLLRTNRLGIGIPISAFVLFLLDHMVISVVGKLTPKRNQVQVHDTVIVESSGFHKALMEEIQPLSEDAAEPSPSCSEGHQDEESKIRKRSSRGKIRAKLRRLFGKRSDTKRIIQEDERCSVSTPGSCKDECVVAPMPLTSEVVEVSERKESMVKMAETRDKMSFLMVGFVILVGVIGSSRPVAVLLTVLWCLVLRFGSWLSPVRILKLKLVHV